mmetsp:Transcript_24873/g.62557  ORF Transcript_24873/g.62557 Transcript_24873/m.62557 type:complete len:244 (+) Transcript_24873:114-845(+)
MRGTRSTLPACLAGFLSLAAIPPLLLPAPMLSGWPTGWAGAGSAGCRAPGGSMPGGSHVYSYIARPRLCWPCWSACVGESSRLAGRLKREGPLPLPRPPVPHRLASPPPLPPPPPLAPLPVPRFPRPRSDGSRKSGGVAGSGPGADCTLMPPPILPRPGMPHMSAPPYSMPASGSPPTLAPSRLARLSPCPDPGALSPTGAPPSSVGWPRGTWPRPRARPRRPRPLSPGLCVTEKGALAVISG